MKVIISAKLGDEIYQSVDFSFTTEDELDNYSVALEKNIKAKILSEKMLTYSEVGDQGLKPSLNLRLDGNQKMNIEITDYSNFLKYCKETLKYISSLEIITKPIDENT